MMERGLAVAFCPSDCCTDVSRDAGTAETLDGEDKLHRRDLLRAIDFYITVLAMASHDLRQPLQVIVGAHELLARRLTARPEREHLERSEQASNQLEEKFDPAGRSVAAATARKPDPTGTCSARSYSGACCATVQWICTAQRDRLSYLPNTRGDHEPTRAARRNLAQSRA